MFKYVMNIPFGAMKLAVGDTNSKVRKNCVEFDIMCKAYEMDKM
ncbi:MAG: hypothetical protein RR054_01615 [Clostridia bacterium]